MTDIYLKAIDLYGFKTIANLTHIEFSKNLNVITGPSASGKSNLLTAITWVLSDSLDNNQTENKSLFCGTENYPASNFAEVTIYYGKEKDTCSDFKIKRRLDRNGKNLWFINNNTYINFEEFPVRRKNLPITDTAVRLVTEILDKHKAESEEVWIKEILKS